MAITDLGYKIIARHNNSLTPKAGVKLLLALAGIVLVVGFGFARIGAWLVLPFAGLEIVAFAYAFHYIYLHSGDFESITIQNDSIVVEKEIIKKSLQQFFRGIGRKLVCVKLQVLVE